MLFSSVLFAHLFMASFVMVRISLEYISSKETAVSMRDRKQRKSLLNSLISIITTFRMSLILLEISAFLAQDNACIQSLEQFCFVLQNFPLTNP